MVIHPAVIHFPIAFNFLETFLVSLGFIKKDDRYHSFARFIFKAAVVMLVMAAIAGIYDAGGLPRAWEVHKVRRHMLSALLLFSWYLFRIFSRNARWNSNPVAVMIILLIGNAMAALTADWGGDLVYTE